MDYLLRNGNVLGISEIKWLMVNINKFGKINTENEFVFIG